MPFLVTFLFLQLFLNISVVTLTDWLWCKKRHPATVPCICELLPASQAGHMFLCALKASLAAELPWFPDNSFLVHVKFRHKLHTYISINLHVRFQFCLSHFHIIFLCMVCVTHTVMFHLRRAIINTLLSTECVMEEQHPNHSMWWP